MAGDAAPPGPTPQRPLGPARRSRLALLGWPRSRRAAIALSLCGLLLVSVFAGVAYYWHQQESAEQDYVELYLTDLPANFTKLEIRLGGVSVGRAGYPLILDTPSFDLLTLRGPAEALRVASGYVPAGEHEEVRVEFQSARAELNGRWISLEIPHRVLTVSHAFGMGANPSSAFLFDLNVDRSVRVSADGLLFEPQVDSVYVHHYGAEPGWPGGPSMGRGPAGFTKSDPKPFVNGTQSSPQKQSLGDVSTRSGPTTGGATTTKPRFQWNPATTSQPAGSGTPTAGAAEETDPAPPSDPENTFASALPSPGDANSVPDDPLDIGGWWGHFVARPPEILVDTVEEHGGVVYLVLGAEPIVYFFATASQAENVSRDPDALLVEADTFLNPHLQSSKPAIQLPRVHDPLFGVKDAAGNALDGRGVGVAVVDLGIDGTHPDLPYKGLNPDPLVLANYKVESLFTVDVPTTDQSSGHGTHVAGILAGRGLVNPAQKGVAPGVKIYGFGIGEASTTLWPVTALDWIVQNHDRVDPPIRIVQNSWATKDPSTAVETLVTRLAAEGVVVVFSAGNAAGDGSSVRTSHQCRIPAEGVVCVASFDDLDVGVRDGRLATSSSRGSVDRPATWPDLAAPGVAIRSTKPVAGTTTLGSGLLDRYAMMSGTSMAAPHVSGVVALMLQANPDLSPAEVEAILEATAYPFAEGGSYAASADPRYDGSHYAKGHGLVDAYDAVLAAKAT